MIADAAGAQIWLAEESTSTMPACVSSPRRPTMKPHGCELPADGAHRAASRMARSAGPASTWERS